MNKNLLRRPGHVNGRQLDATAVQRLFDELLQRRQWLLWCWLVGGHCWVVVVVLVVHDDDDDDDEEINKCVFLTKFREALK